MSKNDRYSRQIRFDPLGEEGQRSLADSSVLLVGVGALGSHLAPYLRSRVALLRCAFRQLRKKEIGPQAMARKIVAGVRTTGPWRERISALTTSPQRPRLPQTRIGIRTVRLVRSIRMLWGAG